MHGPEIELPLVYLQPGQMHIARSPSVLKTILGSCVGVAFWGPRLGIGALCHAVLPKVPRDAYHKLLASEGYRYVDYCIVELARQFDGFGVARTEIQIKLFGGADVLPVADDRRAKETVGRQNSRVALDILQKESLSVVASDLGGTVGRVIEFHTATGEVFVRRMDRPDFQHDDNASGCHAGPQS